MRYTHPDDARAEIARLATGNTAYYLLTALEYHASRCAYGASPTGAFPHTPNPDVTAIWQTLADLFGGVRERLRGYGYASDEREAAMQHMVDRVAGGDLLDGETIETLTHGVDR
jgi:hypothetical protein